MSSTITFWVFFNDPSLVDNTEQSRFLAANSRNLQLPAELESNAPVLRHWLSFAEGERRYLPPEPPWSRPKESGCCRKERG